MTTSGLDMHWSDSIRCDGVASITSHGREVLQRIFVTLRDQDWNETSPTSWHRTVDRTRGTATLSARHEIESVGFEWTGTLRVSDDLRRIRFDISGRALRDMSVCRVGLVVLHPVESMICSSITAQGPDARAQMTVGPTIAPQPIVNGLPVAMMEPFSQLVIDREGWGRVELRFDGDLFELEDQRNWGDASFKTYCTPLRLGFPRDMKKGEKIRHSVEVTFEPAIGKSLTHPATSAGIFPRLGHVSEASGATPSRTARYFDTEWEHVHIDLNSGIENWSTLHDLLAGGAPQKLQLGIESREIGPDPGLSALLREYRQRIIRVFLYGPGAGAPPVEACVRWNRLLTELCGSHEPIPIFAAVRGHFVEFNREAGNPPPVRGVGFPLTATVHATDPETIASNVSAIADMASMVHSRGGEVCVNPLALFHPHCANSRQRFPERMVAPWLVATLIHAAFGKVQSVTLSNDVLNSMSIKQNDTKRMFEVLGTCGGKQVMMVGRSLPRNLHAARVVSEAPGEPRILVANLSEQTIAMDLSECCPKPSAAILATTGDALSIKRAQLEIPGYSVAFLV